MGDVWGEEARVGGGTGDDNRTLDPPRTPPSASPTYAGAQLGSEIVVDEIIGNGEFHQFEDASARCPARFWDILRD